MALRFSSGELLLLFDALGRQVAEQDALGRRTTVTFDAAGNAVLKVDARNWAVTYQLDLLNREQGRQYRDGSRVTLGYDAASQVTQVFNALGLWTRT